MWALWDSLRVTWYFFCGCFCCCCSARFAIGSTDWLMMICDVLNPMELWSMLQIRPTLWLPVPLCGAVHAPKPEGTQTWTWNGHIIRWAIALACTYILVYFTWEASSRCRAPEPRHPIHIAQHRNDKLHYKFIKTVNEMCAYGLFQFYVAIHFLVFHIHNSQFRSERALWFLWKSTKSDRHCADATSFESGLALICCNQREHMQMPICNRTTHSYLIIFRWCRRCSRCSRCTTIYICIVCGSFMRFHNQ